MDCKKLFLIANTALLLLTGFVSAQPYRCPDLSMDDSVVFADFAVFANNWQKSGIGLEGDFDYSGTVDIYDLAFLSYHWLSEYECKSADFNFDYIVNFADLAMLANIWLTDVNDTNWDAACDLDYSEYIDSDDLRILCSRWLKTYPEPNEIFDSLKNALADGDIDTALTFIADSSKEKYEEIFQVVGSNLPDFAAGMGALALELQDEGRAVYEMDHQDGSITYSFPVVFIKDDDGNWKILNF